MPYAIARIYANSGTMTPEQLSALAIKELAPKLGQGLVRYSTVAINDGRVGSFAIYESEDAAGQAAQIAADWVKSNTALQDLKLVETIAGEIIYVAPGTADREGAQCSVARIYRSGASIEELKAALDQEADDIIRTFPGLVRYAVVKSPDGRVGIFCGFDTLENARRSTEQAKALRSKPGSRLATLLPSDPDVIESRPLGIYHAK
jgi:hypothetical protein